MNNSRGVTLIELLIYVVLFTIVSVLIGSQVKTMLRGYTGGRRISSIQSDSRDVLAMIGREIKNTGFKTYLTNDSLNAWTKQVDAGVKLADGSSFVHGEGNPGDTLTIRKGILDNSGSYTGNESVTFYLNGTTLERKSGDAVWRLAENVYALQFQYGIFAHQQSLLQQNPIAVANWTGSNSTLSVSGSALRVAVANAVTGYVTCNTPLDFQADQRITLDFLVSAQSGFPAAMEWVEWRITRGSATGSLITAERFHPNTFQNRIKIPVRQEGNARLSLFFKTTGSCTLLVNNIRVQTADLGRYDWSDNPPANQKSSVRAIRIQLLTRTRGEASTTENTPIQVGNVSISRSGAFVWRLYTEVVEVPNNGLN